MKQWGAKNKAAYIELKSKPCFDCGKSFPHYIMEYDHVRGKKYKNLALLSYQSPTSPVLLAELAKCDLVCANCHAIRTYFRRVHP